MRELTDESPTWHAQEASRRIYVQHVGHLSRAERRTARGRQLVAEAEVAALRERVRVLEEYLAAQRGKGGGK